MKLYFLVSSDVHCGLTYVQVGLGCVGLFHAKR